MHGGEVLVHSTTSTEGYTFVLKFPWTCACMAQCLSVFRNTKTNYNEGKCTCMSSLHGCGTELIVYCYSSVPHSCIVMSACSDGSVCIFIGWEYKSDSIVFWQVCYA